MALFLLLKKLDIPVLEWPAGKEYAGLALGVMGHIVIYYHAPADDGLRLTALSRRSSAVYESLLQLKRVLTKEDVPMSTVAGIHDAIGAICRQAVLAEINSNNVLAEIAAQQYESKAPTTTNQTALPPLTDTDLSNGGAYGNAAVEGALMRLEHRIVQAKKLLELCGRNKPLSANDICYSVAAEMRKKYIRRQFVDADRRIVIRTRELFDALIEAGRKHKDSSCFIDISGRNPDYEEANANYLCKYMPEMPIHLIEGECQKWGTSRRGISSKQIGDIDLRMPPLSASAISFLPTLYEVCRRCNIAPQHLCSELAIRLIPTYYDQRFSLYHRPIFVNALRSRGFSDPKISRAVAAGVFAYDGIRYVNEPADYYLHESEWPVAVECEHITLLSTLCELQNGIAKTYLVVNARGRLHYLLDLLGRSAGTNNDVRRLVHCFVAANMRLTLGIIAREYLMFRMTTGSAHYSFDMVERLQKYWISSTIYRSEYDVAQLQRVALYPINTGMGTTTNTTPTVYRVWDPRLKLTITLTKGSTRYYRCRRETAPHHLVGASPLWGQSQDGEIINYENGFPVSHWIHLGLKVPANILDQVVQYSRANMTTPCANSVVILPNESNLGASVLLWNQHIDSLLDDMAPSSSGGDSTSTNMNNNNASDDAPLDEWMDEWTVVDPNDASSASSATTGTAAVDQGAANNNNNTMISGDTMSTSASSSSSVTATSEGAGSSSTISSSDSSAAAADDEKSALMDGDSINNNYQVIPDVSASGVVPRLVNLHRSAPPNRRMPSGSIPGPSSAFYSSNNTMEEDDDIDVVLPSSIDVVLPSPDMARVSGPDPPLSTRGQKRRITDD